MKVRAIKDNGYYNHKLWKEGEVFEMDENVYAPKNEDGSPILNKKTGLPKICSWVEPFNEPDEEEKPKTKTKVRKPDVDKGAEVI